MQEQKVVVFAFSQAIDSFDIEAGDSRSGVTFVSGREALAILTE